MSQERRGKEHGLHSGCRKEANCSCQFFKENWRYIFISRNLKPDALSCQFASDPVDEAPVPILPPSCILGAAYWEVEEKVREAQQCALDPGGCPPNWLFVPEGVRSEVLQWAHMSKLTCHPGVSHTMQFLWQRFWWPSMTRDTKDYVAPAPCVPGGRLPTSHLQDSSCSWIFIYAHGCTSRWTLSLVSPSPMSTRSSWPWSIGFQRLLIWSPFQNVHWRETGELLVQHVVRAHGIVSERHCVRPGSSVLLSGVEGFLLGTGRFC